MLEQTHCIICGNLFSRGKNRSDVTRCGNCWDKKPTSFETRLIDMGVRLAYIMGTLNSFQTDGIAYSHAQKIAEHIEQLRKGLV